MNRKPNVLFILSDQHNADENEISLPPNWRYDMKDKAPHLRQSVQSFIDTAEDWTVVEPHTYESGCRRKMHGYLGNVSIDSAIF